MATAPAVAIDDEPSTSGGSSNSSNRFHAIRSRQYDGLAFFHHMVAGAFAGTVEHTAMYPVDTIKTRMQALSHPGQRLRGTSVLGAIQSALKREGIAGLYKGVGAVALGAGPAHAIHFGVYELSKELMGGNTGSGHHPAIAAASAAIATVVNEAVMTPVDVVKQRLQVAHSPYSGVLDCVRKTLKAEGPGAFYKSYRTTLIMNIPFQAIHFAIYEAAKKVMLEPDAVRKLLQRPPPPPLPPPLGSVPSSSGSSGSGSGSSSSGGSSSSSSSSSGQGEGYVEEVEALEDNLATQLLAGGMAGGIAAAVTTPFDVVKTRLQTEGVHSAIKYGGMIATMRRIVREEGAASLWRGLKPRVLFHVPAAAVCWGTYETLKAFLTETAGHEE